MSPKAIELSIFIDNDATLYRQMTLPILKNLTRKKKNGTYKHEFAVKAFMHLANEGAKRFVKEFPGTSWFKTFSVSDRKQVAQEAVHSFEEEYRLGNY